MIRPLGALSIAAIILLGGLALPAQQSLEIGNDVAPGLAPRTLPVRLTNTAPVEGFVLAVAIDATLVQIDDVSVTGTITESSGAEFVIPEILAGQGFTLGVVLDSGPPFDAQTIPAGTAQTIANFTARPIIIVAVPVDAVFQFVDGVLNSPPLDNVIVQGGQSIGAPQGLGLIDGALTLEVPPPDTLTNESGSGPSDGIGAVRILLSNSSGNVQGFVLAIAHDSAALDLEQITITGTITATVGAELVVPQIFPNGGTIGVVLDFQAPFAGQTIPVGIDQHIATYRYSCDAPTIQPSPDQISDLLFVDGVLNTPPLDNVIVIGGFSINPGLVHGTYTCVAVPPPPVENTKYHCGPPDFSGQPGPIEGAIGDTVEVCFYYEDQDDNIQGFQLAVCFDCDLTFSSFSIEGSILDEIGAEFVNSSVDNDPSDGDGCEFVAGILLDALPPFANQTAPATFFPLLIGCLEATIESTAPCGEDLLIEFCSGVDAGGSVSLENIVVIDFQSVQDFQRNDCAIHVSPQDLFRRGDCNSDDKVDLADASTVLGAQFFGVSILCPDACDANDDGKINLADSIHVLMYLFLAGTEPPAPGPEVEGPDPTEDLLPICESDTPC